MSDRWIANKFGLFDFWYYDEEEFELSNGKIIFRGTNGSGKSVTTQSFIPLLLDGDKRPNRLDPFGTSARKIENYLLLNEEENDKIAYLYMEFVKPSSNTYLTIGIGFRARRGKKLDCWHFILKDGRRINKELKLYKKREGKKFALTDKEFKNALGEGNIYTTSPKEYMEKVNEHLFGYSDIDSYKDLLNLLIQVRSPKLSKDFKPTVIYEILKSSLSLLSEDDLRTMSEAMDNMDSLNNNLEELKKSRIDMDQLQFDRAAICLNLTDMRGISEQISITLGDSVYIFEPGMDNRGIANTGVHAIANLSELKQNKKLPYEIKIKLKGSQSLNFIPLGKTTRVDLKANWNTPSFTGNYLPNNRNITEKEFSAQWQVLNLNRNYSQVMVDFNTSNIKDIESSSFGVNFKIPVEQYQQSMRSAKYAILIILLTFGVIFFTEIMNKTRIHALQYLLVGLALCLFYSLLLSFSEHVGFNPAYLLSSALTIILVGGYMFGITKKKKPSLIMSGLLTILYIYIFVLIQLETFALLAGSLGLFIILAIVMYFSKKIDWFNE